jgi:lipoprotein-anchoring transpeptidase ErfK/SrfK
MFLRLAAGLALLAMGFVLPLGQAAAQYYPPNPERYVPPPPYRSLPPAVFEDEEEPVIVPRYREAPLPLNRQPEARRGWEASPSPRDQETYIVPPPGFIYSDRDPAPPPPPFGHVPGGEIQRGDVAPANPNAPRPPAGIGASEPSIMSLLPPEDQPEAGQPKELPPQFRRQLVDYRTKEPAGTIIIDTPNTYLYLVLGNGQAMRYGIGVGREGFTWAGTERVSRMAEWPDWHPPEEMIERQPYLPRFMAGGEGNPLGARALYLGKTLFRIHGTNQPSTIGSFVSSGCVRLVNADIEDLYQRVQVGTRVVVLPGAKPTAQAAKPPATAEAEQR